MKATRICDFPECGRRVKAKGLCPGHYQQHNRGGTLKPLGWYRASPWERLMRRRVVDPITGCWEWLGTLDNNGYARITVEGSTLYAHRVSWEHHKSAIPGDRVVDHVCENRGCFNPDHLELVTPAENTNRRKGAQALRTHCPQGHRYAGDNLRIYVDKRGYPHRVCVICNKVRARAQYHARRTTANV